MNRRHFLGSMSTLALGAGITNAKEPIEKKTYTYKTVDKLEIQADVYGAGDKTKPAVLWIHGGALIMGGRGGVGMDRDALIDAGFVIISIDYRLAPETKLPGILDDVRDAWNWLQEKGPKLLNIDPKRIVVAGGSAGGYLTLTTGYRVQPRPRALISYWGYGDLIADWYSKPDAFYRKSPLVSEEEARGVVGSEAVAGPTKKNRGRFYLYCRQNGLWPKLVAGIDPVKDPKAFDPYCPLRNVTADYPPTLLIHGTKDTDVPYEESANMDKELTRKGVDHELITIKDAGHGLSGAKPAELAMVKEKVMKFLKQHSG